MRVRISKFGKDHQHISHVNLASYPGPLREEKGPGTHCLRMCYFPSKSWEFIFLSVYYSVNVTLDLSCMPKNRQSLPQFFAKDTYCDESSYHK